MPARSVKMLRQEIASARKTDSMAVLHPDTLEALLDERLLFITAVREAGGKNMSAAYYKVLDVRDFQSGSAAV